MIRKHMNRGPIVCSPIHTSMRRWCSIWMFYWHNTKEHRESNTDIHDNRTNYCRNRRQTRNYHIVVSPLSASKNTF